MDRKEADILSQILGAMLEEQEFDQAKLSSLESKLERLTQADNKNAATHNGVSAEFDDDFQNHQANTTAGDDPFAATPPVAAPPANTYTNPQDPFEQQHDWSTDFNDNADNEQEGSLGNTAALETEIDLLKEELKAMKEQASKFELLYKRKEEEANSQSAMIEMTVNHVMADLTNAQQKIMIADEMKSTVSLLENGFYGSKSKLNEWFPNSLFWHGQEYDQLPFRLYCVQHFSMRYVIAVSVPFAERQKSVVALTLQLMLYARITADRYTNASLIYEYYEQCMQTIAGVLDTEFNGHLQGCVMVFDEELGEAAISGNKMSIYQQEGNLIRLLELGKAYHAEDDASTVLQQYRIKRARLETGVRWITPLAIQRTEEFDLFLQEAGNLEDTLQQTYLQSRYNQGVFPKDFALLSLNT